MASRIITTTITTGITDISNTAGTSVIAGIDTAKHGIADIERLARQRLESTAEEIATKS